MKTPYKLLLFMLVLPLLVFANTVNPTNKYTKQKKLSKQYTVNPNALLVIDNSYGNVDMISWNGNTIEIDVTIITRGNDEEDTQEKLDNITVEFTGNSNEVSAKTIFKNRKSNSWSWWGGKNENIQMEINYTVKLPVSNTIDVSNDYGTITLNELKGKATINCDYGQINIGSLFADNNLLTFDYTKNSSVAYIKSGRVEADYAAFSIEKADKIVLEADYTHSDFKDIGFLTYDNSYGKITIGSVGKLEGDSNYLPLRIESLKESLEVNTDYGSVSIDKLEKTVKNVNINSDYAGIKIGYDQALSFNFSIDLSYANLSGDEALQIKNTSKNYTSKTYSGFYGDEHTTNTIKINSDYGGVTFRKL